MPAGRLAAAFRVVDDDDDDEEALLTFVELLLKIDECWPANEEEASEAVEIVETVGTTELAAADGVEKAEAGVERACNNGGAVRPYPATSAEVRPLPIGDDR